MEDTDEHPSPLPIIDIEIEVNDPAVRDLKVPAVRFAVADRSHDARRFTRFEDDHYGIVLRPFEIRVDEVIAPAFRRFHNWDVPLL
jgi:hypothetical protein